MTTITAKIIADSISPEGIRLTTFQLRYPYVIHGEFMTHRVFARNASSTRAIPVKELIRRIEEDPFVPLHWGKNQPGMQAHEECARTVAQYLDGELDCYTDRSTAWLNAMHDAVRHARAFADAGYHKQVANRLLMPFMHMDTVCTATDWANFFHLRIHPDAEPHIQMLAKTMKQQLDLATPTLLQPGQWHLPYITHDDWIDAVGMGVPDETTFKPLIKQSVARCAWVSYTDPLGKKATYEQEEALHDRLVVSEPLHATPAEHQATPDALKLRAYGTKEAIPFEWTYPEQHGPLRGWRQYRKMLPNECKQED